MRVNEAIRKSVFFLGIRTPDGSFSPYGTAFGVAWQEGNIIVKYIITAKHVVEDIKETKLPPVARLLRKNGTLELKSIDQWIWHCHADHPNLDIVVAPSELEPTEYDYTVCSLRGILTPEYISKFDVGCGDEVCMVGLLTRHIGQTKNLPIARIGNIAAMPEEAVDLQSAGSHEVYLIETRSIGGLSGSPVYLNTPAERLVGTEFVSTIGHESEYLMGVNVGLFQVGTETDKMPVEPSSPRKDFLETMSAGISVVIPIQRAIEIMLLPQLVDDRERSIAGLIARDPTARRT